MVTELKFPNSNPNDLASMVCVLLSADAGSGSQKGNPDLYNSSMNPWDNSVHFSGLVVIS